MAASAGMRGKVQDPVSEMESQKDNSQDANVEDSNRQELRYEDINIDDVFANSELYEKEKAEDEAEAVALASQNKKSADKPPDPNTLLIKIYEDIKGMRTEMGQMSSKLDTALSDIGTHEKKIEQLEVKTVSLQTKLDKANNEITSLKHKNVILNERIVQLDTYSRKNNLIFRGVEQTKEENCNAKIKKILEEKLQLKNVENIRFERCHRLNTMTKPQPIICRFSWYQDRQNVWQSRKKLKGHDVSLSEDFPHEIQESRKTLYPIMKQARSLGHIAYIAGEKLTIADKTYTVSSLNTLPEDLDPAKRTTRKVGNVTGFFSKSSPLSNFFEAPFEIGNKTFSSTEQYLQYSKAEYAELPELAGKINCTKSALECKKMGDNIKLDASKWLPIAKKVLARGCLAKFEQNHRAKYFLLTTGNTILAEATKDKYWGIGLTLDSDAVGDPKQWPGQNTFGLILEEVRAKIRESTENK